MHESGAAFGRQFAPHFVRRRAVIAAALAGPAFASAKAQGLGGDVDLSQDPLGPLPPEFLTSLRTGRGAPGDWRIVADPSASRGKAIAQLNADPTDYRFPLALYEPLAAQNVETSVRFKAVSGRGARAGGLAVRLRTADNYCLVRANALENNVRLYRVANGDRQQLASASTKVASGMWHTLTLRAEADRLFATFNGKPLLSVSDRTFIGLGKVALWTEADSVIHFDQLRIHPFR